MLSNFCPRRFTRFENLRRVLKNHSLRVSLSSFDKTKVTLAFVIQPSSPYSEREMVFVESFGRLFRIREEVKKI